MEIEKKRGREKKKRQRKYETTKWVEKRKT